MNLVGEHRENVPSLSINPHEPPLRTSQEHPSAPPKTPKPQNPKTPKPQNPKTPKPQNPKTPKPQNPICYSIFILYLNNKLLAHIIYYLLNII